MTYAITGPRQVPFRAALIGVGASPTPFDPDAVWDLVERGNIVGRDYEAMQATKAIQAGLNGLGFGPLHVDGAWGPATEAAWEKFMLQEGLSTKTGVVQKDGVYRMGERLGSPSSAGMGIGLLALAAAGAAIWVVAKKKRRGR